MGVYVHLEDPRRLSAATATAVTRAGIFQTARPGSYEALC